MLKHCTACGPSEELVAADGAGLGGARSSPAATCPRDALGDHLFKHTTSTCPQCLDAGPGRRRDPHGPRLLQEELREAAARRRRWSPRTRRYYVRAYAFARAGTEPLKFARHVEHGCPTDCGTCDDHEQHTCLPIVEVTDHCNLECPICIVDNQYANHMEPDDVRAASSTGWSTQRGPVRVDRALGRRADQPPAASSSCCDIANRPRDRPRRAHHQRLRLGRDRALRRGAQGRRAPTSALQLDGFTAETHEKIRGRDLCRGEGGRARDAQGARRSRRS